MKLYPLQFYPILKERIWGGTKLNTYLGKSIESNTTGESWELSTVQDNCSVISHGTLKGKSLDTLIEEFPNEILGKEVYAKFGNQFPLLIKFLDAREDLSIQVHPNDELAKKRHNSFGKTEMWYVMQADKDARLIVGFKENSSAKEYQNSLENKTLLSILDSKKVNQGDVFFLETGTVHAIGAGVVIAEIQQTSDITYRLYDFERTDKDGNLRELHVDLAMEAINYNYVDVEKKYDKSINFSNEIVNCPYFTTHFLPLNGEVNVAKNGDSFTIYICTKGTFKLEFEDTIYNYKLGDVVLIPASISEYQLIGDADILEVFISK